MSQDAIALQGTDAPAPSMASATTARSRSLRERPLDLVLVVFFGIFAWSSLIMEMYIVFGVDLAASADPFARLWHFYAARWDPIFLDTPLWLRIMCGIDAFVFGPFYIVAIYAFVKERRWIRIPALLYASAIVYSTVVYFAAEFIGEAHRADLWMVFLVNIPYTVVPLVLAWRVRHPDPFLALAPQPRPAAAQEPRRSPRRGPSRPEVAYPSSARHATPARTAPVLLARPACKRRRKSASRLRPLV